MDGWKREGKAFQERKIKVTINDNKGDDLMGSLHRELMRLVLQGSQFLRKQMKTNQRRAEAGHLF